MSTANPDPNWLEREQALIAKKYPENFRKSLAYYVGGQIPYDHDQREEWKARAFAIVDLALLGIEQSDSYRLVRATGQEGS